MPPLALRLAFAVVLALLVAPFARALHRVTPAGIRISRGTPVALPRTRSWGYVTAFTSPDDLAGTNSTGNQIFLFRLFDYDCVIGPQTGELATCPGSPEPLVQVTTGPGSPDNASADRADNVAFDADGSYAGGAGPGVGRRQIFVKNLANSSLIRVTDASGGDSIRPSLDERGRHLVFESTAPLLGGPAGGSQVYLYDLRASVLTRITSGAGPSTAPMLTKLGRLIAFESTADLLGDGHDTGVSQIFWWDGLDGTLHQLTNGNGASRRPYVTNRLKSALKKVAGRGPRSRSSRSRPTCRAPPADPARRLPRHDARRRSAADPPGHARPVGGCAPPVPATARIPPSMPSGGASRSSAPATSSATRRADDAPSCSTRRSYPRRSCS
jgi:hypothetical protein